MEFQKTRLKDGDDGLRVDEVKVSIDDRRPPVNEVGPATGATELPFDAVRLGIDAILAGLRAFVRRDDTVNY